MQDIRFRRAFLLLLVVTITVLFVAVIRQFLITILLAAIFSAMAHPLYDRILRAFRGRRVLASLVTLAILLLCVMAPLLGFAALVAREALRITESVRPWAEQVIREPGILFGYLEQVPGFRELEPYRDEILAKLAQVVEGIGNFALQSLSATTRGTLSFFFKFFLLLYTMFFFLMDGEALLRRILYYLPLPHEDEMRMVEKFVSVSRATLKGTLVIGVIQGALAGAAFAVAGVEGAVFWGTVMAVLSVIPGIGTGLIWVPAAVYLAASGHVLAGVMLGLFCLLVVGSVDNFLRPRLVGKDVKMHDLLILFSTLGGLLLFGVIGFIIGPIVAALFVTVWDIYGIAFREALPAVGPLGKGPKSGRKPSGE
jgi:predicted PurR-regulated permease PerM